MRNSKIVKIVTEKEMEEDFWIVARRIKHFKESSDSHGEKILFMRLQ